MTFVVPWIRLEIPCFSMAFWVPSELRAHCRMVVIGCCLGPIAVTKQYGVVLQHVKCNIKLAGIKAYEKTRMQSTKTRQIKAAR